MRMGPRQSQIAVITGASSGIGLYAAKTLASAGNWHVILACRDVGRAEQAAAQSQLPRDAYTVLPCDLASFESVQAFARNLTGQAGVDHVDALVCNAAIWHPVPPEPRVVVSGAAAEAEDVTRSGGVPDHADALTGHAARYDPAAGQPGRHVRAGARSGSGHHRHDGQRTVRAHQSVQRRQGGECVDDAGDERALQQGRSDVGGRLPGLCGRHQPLPREACLVPPPLLPAAAEVCHPPIRAQRGGRPPRGRGGLAGHLLRLGFVLSVAGELLCRAREDPPRGDPAHHRGGQGGPLVRAGCNERGSGGGTGDESVCVADDAVNASRIGFFFEMQAAVGKNALVVGHECRVGEQNAPPTEARGRMAPLADRSLSSDDPVESVFVTHDVV
eukprot:ctg_868.g430